MTRNFYKKLMLAVIFIFLMGSSLSNLTFANENKQQHKQVIMVVINQVNYQDLMQMKSVEDIINKGGVGLLNTRTAGKAIIPKAYATIGAGVRAEGNWTSSEAQPATKENEIIYKTRTGQKVPKGGILNLEINQLISYNEEGEYGATAGQLGTLIRNAGLKTAAYGNMDVGEENRRPHVLIAMDQWGRVDQGEVSRNILIEDPTYPGELRTDFSKIYNYIKENKNFPALTVVETGDITRLEEEKVNLSPQMYEKHKKDTLQRFDDFIEKTKKLVDKENKLLVLVTPFANQEDRSEGYELTPVVMYGDGVEKGLLISDTTRREGFISNVDIAPTILSYLGIEKENMVGQPIHVVPGEKDYLNKLLETNEFVVANSNNRLPILTMFVAYQIVLLIVALFMVLFKRNISEKYINVFKKFLLSGMIIPIVLLYIPIFEIKNLFLYIIAIIAITFLLSWIVNYIENKMEDPLIPIIFITLFTALSLIIDIIMGTPLVKISLLGYDPVIGARYYGIGNEYMGILIGSSLVLLFASKEKISIDKNIILGLLIFLIIIIGYPEFGANVGGTITITAAAIFIFFKLFHIKLGWKQVIFAGIGIISVVSIMAVIDVFFVESQSHLAGAISSIREGGIVELSMIILRKISMNIKLFGVTVWSKVLVVSIIVFAIIFNRPPGLLKGVIDKYSCLSIGWTAVVIASIVGFLVNDSGVVAAATCIIYLSFSLLYILIQEPHNV
ncbi:hypothetical protein [Garciella nitratireducens]|uniref:Uncharacterized protein n=1 Tax=Garciella nitratireducens DSM 15102 TaxID=1121911 RepID=A0A1T4JSX4_9FIRM|nr:hypothetical protein [Garciella nitratireducens]SJZ33243.1 hypothetical protein SAMN02745973_00063 [Garciella nitratireducens DSM 15102]